MLLSLRLTMTDEQNSLTGATNLLKLLSCPVCGLAMSLSHIKPGEAGYDRLTFVCRDCRSSDTIVVAREKATTSHQTHVSGTTGEDDVPVKFGD